MIEYSVNLESGQEQTLLLDQLSSHLSRKSNETSGQIISTPSGGYLSTTKMKIAGDTEYWLEWNFLYDSQKTLLSIQVRPLETVDAGWEALARQLINDALFSALRKDVIRRHFRTHLYYLGPELDGEYWFRHVRIAPVYVSTEMRSVRNFERVITLDFEVEAVDTEAASLRASQLTKTYASRLALLLNIDFYQSSSEQVWVRTGPDSSQRLAHGYVDPTPYPQKMPSKGDMRAGTFNSITELLRPHGPLKMPRETRKIFRHIENDARFARAFDNAARLWQIGLSLGRRFPTAALSYQVAAVESLAQASSPKKAFSDFMREYSTRAAERQDLLEFLYRPIRSAHFHSGEFALGEFGEKKMNVMLEPESSELSLSEYHGQLSIREAVTTWLLRQLAEQAE